MVQNKPFFEEYESLDVFDAQEINKRSGKWIRYNDGESEWITSKTMVWEVLLVCDFFNEARLNDIRFSFSLKQIVSFLLCLVEEALQFLLVSSIPFVIDRL